MIESIGNSNLDLFYKFFGFSEYVIQRRSGSYGSCSSSTCTDRLFDTTWEGYKSNFSNAQGDYWIGLETLHTLTNIAGLTWRLEVKQIKESEFAGVK